MKKFLRSTLVRALCILALGVALIIFSTEVTRWMIMATGVIFIVPGCVSLISYFRRDPEGRGLLLQPVIGAGSILFGLVLLIVPGTFIHLFVYLLSVLLVLAAATQCYTLWSMQRAGVRLHPFFYLAPAAELVLGLFLFFTDKKEEIAGLPVVLIGVGFILYALMELGTLYAIRLSNKVAPSSDAKLPVA